MTNSSAILACAHFHARLTDLIRNAKGNRILIRKGKRYDQQLCNPCLRTFQYSAYRSYSKCRGNRILIRLRKGYDQQLCNPCLHTFHARLTDLNRNAKGNRILIRYEMLQVLEIYSE